MSRFARASLLAVVGAMLLWSCSPAPTGPTPSRDSAPSAGLGAGVHIDAATAINAAVAFPPRNEPFDFRANTLEAKYRDQLRRSAISTFVDIEGSIVWTQEYLRYRLSACSDADAVQKVMAQIDGRGVQPDCGGTQTAGTPAAVTFPPRNETFSFRAQMLEGKYRDGLRRSPTTSFVDIEGDIVWTQEYLRYRVNGCDHATAVQKVIDQIDGRGVQPVCATVTTSTVSTTTVTTSTGSTTTTTIPGSSSTTTTTIRTTSTTTTTTSIPYPYRRFIRP